MLTTTTTIAIIKYQAKNKTEEEETENELSAHQQRQSQMKDEAKEKNAKHHSTMLCKTEKLCVYLFLFFSRCCCCCRFTPLSFEKPFCRCFPLEKLKPNCICAKWERAERHISWVHNNALDQQKKSSHAVIKSQNLCRGVRAAKKRDCRIVDSWVNDLWCYLKRFFFFVCVSVFFCFFSIIIKLQREKNLQITTNLFNRRLCK